MRKTAGLANIALSHPVRRATMFSFGELFSHAFTDVEIAPEWRNYSTAEGVITRVRFKQRFCSDGATCTVIVMQDSAGRESIQVELSAGGKNYGCINDYIKSCIEITEEEIPPTAINLACIIYHITELFTVKRLAQEVDELRASR
jgi:hypothetical protein